MRNTKFYICPHCRNIAEMIYDTNIALHCCGDEMQELCPGTVEASHEKHIPAVKAEAGKVEVNVGSVDHPMVDIHWIEWVQLVTDKGSYRKWLNPGDAPNVVFLVGDEKPLEVYAYCNLHGLWKKELN